MGGTTNIDLNKEAPLSELALPPEKLTPEYKAKVEKFYSPDTPAALTPRTGTPITDAFRETLKDPQKAQAAADAGNALAAGLRAVSEVKEAQSVIPEQVPPQITFDQFRAVEIVVGEVKAVETVPKANKMLKLFVDFGARGSKVVLAGIVKSFPDGMAQAQLVGSRYAFVFNLPPRPMFGIQSEAMLLAAKDATDPEKVVLVTCPGAEVGARLS